MVLVSMMRQGGEFGQGFPGVESRPGGAGVSVQERMMSIFVEIKCLGKRRFVDLTLPLAV